MPKITDEITLKRSFWGKPLRPAATVVQDFFRLHIALDRRSVKYLSWYPEPQYRIIKYLAQGVRGLKKFDRLMVDPYEKISHIDLSAIPANFLVEQIEGTILDLRKLQDKLNQYKKRLPVSQMPITMVLPDRECKVSKDRSDYDPERLWNDLQRHFHVKAVSFNDITSGRKVALEVMDARRLDTQPDRVVIPLISCLREISSKAWEQNVGRRIPGYSSDFIFDHFIKIDREFLVRDPKNGEFVAFSGINKLDDRKGLQVNMLEVSMIKPPYQNMRISSTLVSRLIIDAFIANNLNPMIVAGRTANPQVLGAMRALENVFPDPSRPDTLPSEEQKKIFRFVSGHTNPNEPKDENTFVLHDVYPLESGLIVPPYRIPSYAKDLRVNELCRNRLEYERFNSPDFFPGELSRSSTGPVLNDLQTIDRRLLDLSSSASDPPEAIFNRMLERTDLPAALQSKLCDVTHRRYTSELIRQTEKIRRKHFFDLDQDARETIRIMNRLLLEDLYSVLPRRKAKAMIVAGVATTEAREDFERRNNKLALRNRVLSQLRRFVNR